MSEPIQTLWFEDLNFINEPLLDTPIGKFSIRQTLITLTFGFLGYMFSLTQTNPLLKITIAITILTLGLSLFMKKTKTIHPEIHMIYIIGLKYKKLIKLQHKKPKMQKPTKQNKNSTNLTISATLNNPIKIVGKLKDPQSNQVLPYKTFELQLDGSFYNKGITDDEGLFSAYFIPSHYGIFPITIKPENSTTPIQHLTVKVTPKEIKQVEDKKT